MSVELLCITIVLRANCVSYEKNHKLVKSENLNKR